MTKDSGSLERLLELVEERFELPDGASARTHLTEDLELSSITFMELVEELEDAFDIIFPLDNVPRIETIGDLAAEIDRLRV